MRPLAQWAIALACLLAGGALAGLALRIGVGGGLFFAGAGAILWSLKDVRLGGVKTRVGRKLDGTPIIGQDLEKRRREIQRGLATFSLGPTVWAILMLGYFLGVVR